MPRERGIKFSVVKKVNTDCSPFEFIIYKPRYEGSLIFEDPTSGECFRGSYKDMTKYIRFTGVTTPWKQDAIGNYIRFNNDNMFQIVKMSNITRWYWFKFNIGNYRSPNVLNNIGQLHNFYVESDGIFHVYLPLLPFYMYFYVRENRVTFRRFFMEYNNRYYMFPYGNTDASGGICLGKSSFLSANDALIQLIDAVSNTDMQIQLRNVKIDNRVPLRMFDENYKDLYSLDSIEKDINEDKSMEFTQLLYYISNRFNNDTFDPNKVFKTIQNPWE